MQRKVVRGIDTDNGALERGERERQVTGSRPFIERTYFGQKSVICWKWEQRDESGAPGGTYLAWSASWVEAGSRGTRHGALR